MSEEKDIKDVAKLFEVIQGKEKQTVGLLTGEFGSIKSPEKSIKQFLDAHFPGSVDHKEQTPIHNFSTIEEMSANEIDFITVEKVQWSIKSFSPDMAAGPDEIKPRVLQHIGSVGVSRLVFLHKTSIKLGYIKSVKGIKSSFHPKALYDNVKAFRPISPA